MSDPTDEVTIPEDTLEETDLDTISGGVSGGSTIGERGGGDPRSG